MQPAHMCRSDRAIIADCCGSASEQGSVGRASKSHDADDQNDVAKPLCKVADLTTENEGRASDGNRNQRERPRHGTIQGLLDKAQWTFPGEGARGCRGECGAGQQYEAPARYPARQSIMLHVSSLRVNDFAAVIVTVGVRDFGISLIRRLPFSLVMKSTISSASPIKRRIGDAVLSSMRLSSRSSAARALFAWLLIPPG